MMIYVYMYEIYTYIQKTIACAGMTFSLENDLEVGWVKYPVLTIHKIIRKII